MKSETPVDTAPRSESFEPQGGAAAQRPAAPRKAGGGPLLILKPNQGIHVRWGTAIGAGVFALAGAQFVWSQLALLDLGSERVNFYVRTLVPVVMLLAAGYGIYWLVGRNQRFVEFLIATEGEMKKVNWSTRKEVWGATKVVIVTVFMLAIIIAVVDLAFMVFFGGIGVLKVDVFSRLIGGG